jgi:hypothetical protein
MDCDVRVKMHDASGVMLDLRLASTSPICIVVQVSLAQRPVAWGLPESTSRQKILYANIEPDV